MKEQKIGGGSHCLIFSSLVIVKQGAVGSQLVKLVTKKNLESS